MRAGVSGLIFVLAAQSAAATSLYRYEVSCAGDEIVLYITSTKIQKLVTGDANMSILNSNRPTHPKPRFIER